MYALFNSEDNIDTVPGLKAALKDWIESLSQPFESHTNIVEELEFKSRDGFHAHSWNKGGLDLILISDIGSLVGSGEHMGLAIESWVNEHYNEAYEAALKEGLEERSEEFYEHLDANTNGEYDSVAYRVRAMYEGDGVLKIYAGYDKDAPYFRWRSKAEFETEIKFKSIAELNTKLKKITKKLEQAQ